MARRLTPRQQRQADRADAAAAVRRFRAADRANDCHGMFNAFGDLRDIAYKERNMPSVRDRRPALLHVRTLDRLDRSLARCYVKR